MQLKKRKNSIFFIFLQYKGRVLIQVNRLVHCEMQSTTNESRILDLEKSLMAKEDQLAECMKTCAGMAEERSSLINRLQESEQKLLQVKSGAEGTARRHVFHLRW